MSGPERHRRWSGDEKASIVVESQRPAAAVGQRYGVHANRLYSWRRELREMVLPEPSALPAAPASQ
ncbi:transposase [Paraburkholderia panacisoli]|uniref:transposase n=1 Tax=Paraburkholderia panacisoli TaxID=2603818 RepID=UPI003CCC88FA